MQYLVAPISKKVSQCDQVVASFCIAMKRLSINGAGIQKSIHSRQKKEEVTLEVEDRRMPRDVTRLLVIVRWIVLARIVDGNDNFLYSVV